MTMVDNSAGIVIKGKTELVLSKEKNIGWFIGIVERNDGEKFIFVNNIYAPSGTIADDKFMMARKAIVGEVFKKLGVVS